MAEAPWWRRHGYDKWWCGVCGGVVLATPDLMECPHCGNDFDFEAFMADDMLVKLQLEQLPWREHNFGKDSPAYHSLLGVFEEAGELAHAVLKSEQGIRGTKEEHEAKIDDSIGDIIIYLADYCSKTNRDLYTVVYNTWNKVCARDWKKYPHNGRTE